MKQHAGFIFLMTLCTVAIISLLVLTCMQHILLYYKAINAIAHQHQQFNQLEAVARDLAFAQYSNLDPDCIEYRDAANQVIERLKKHQGCSKGTQYRYLIEELGDFPCLVIQSQERKYSTHHRRVSVLLLADDNSPESFIQIRHISAMNALSCAGTETEVTEGISSWRYFAALE